jgi:hypothetical protein
MNCGNPLNYGVQNSGDQPEITVYNMPMSRVRKPRPVGRPRTLPGEPGERYQVRLPPSIAAQVRAVGGGSLSRGIIKLAQRKGGRS